MSWIQKSLLGESLNLESSMSVFLAATVIFCTWLAGCAISVLLGRKSILEISGLGFILGTMYMTMAVLLIHQYAGLLITQTMVLTLSYLSGLLSIIILRPFYKHIQVLSPKVVVSIAKAPRLTKVLVGILIILGMSSLLQNYFWPITDWDAHALYDFRARIVAQNGSFVEGIELGYFFQYPPFTSLLHSMLYLAGFDRVKVWYSFLYISLQIVFYVQLRKHTTTSLSLIGTVLLASNPLILEHSTMAYTNLSYTIFLTLGLIYLVDWYRVRSVSTILLGSLLVVSSTWVRLTEPFWIIPLLILVSIVILSFKRKNLKHALAAVIGLIFIFLGKSIWQNFLNMLFLQNVIAPTTTVAPPSTAVEPLVQVDSYSWLTTVPVLSAFKPYIVSLISKDGTFVLQRAGEIASYISAYILPVVEVYLVPAVVLAAFELPKKEQHTIALWCVLVLYLLLLFVGTFAFSLLDGSWTEIGGSANRMSMFLIPLFIFAIFSTQRLHQWQKKIAK
jgi:hypothetical protein